MVNVANQNRVSRWSVARGAVRGIGDRRSWLILALLFCVGSARAQYLGNTGLQTVEVPKVFNAVSTAQTSANIQNLGQTIHILNYVVSGSVPTLVQIRLEGSWDGVTFVPISDDATDLGNGEVVGLGFYPAIRANLVQCVGCGSSTLTANYSGHFAGPSNFNGFYNPSQQIRKVALANVAMNAGQLVKGVVSPYGNTSGVLVISAIGGNFPAASTINVTAHVGEEATSLLTYTLLTTQLVQVIPMPATPSTSIDVTYTSGGASANTFSAYYFFLAPGTIPASVQPQITFNQEVTATNATATVNLSGANLQIPYLYSVSARCSAGTAGLTVLSGATQIWSSGATEVGTTTFRFQWNPGLAGNSDKTLSINLTTCGVANVGTLDVEGSTL